MTILSKPWLRNYPSEVPHSYDYPKQSVADFLVQTAKKHPDRPAIDFFGKRLNYAQLLDESYRFANALLGLGIQKGDRVAVMLPNSPQCVIAFFGTLLMGGIVVMTNPLYMEGELAHQLNDSDAKAIVTLDLLAARVGRVVPKTKVEHVIVTSIKDFLPFPKSMLYPLSLRKNGGLPKVDYSSAVHSFKPLLAASKAEPILTEVDAIEDIAILQYTGGTTGIAKGVMLTHHNLTANMFQNVLWCYRFDEGRERSIGALPLFHVFGLTVLMLQAVYTGGLMILVPKFDPTQVLKLIQKHRATVFPGAPTMYIALLNHPELKKFDLSSINVCVSGSAPLPLEVQEAFEEATGGRLIEGYGLTETSPVTHANPIWGLRKVGTIGLPFPDTEAQIVDSATGEQLPPGQIGELAIRGPQVMKGYWNRPEETRHVLKDGWLFTGDMATMDEDGYFRIVDRKKDLIIAGGFNIYPREIEEALYEHPAIKEVAVAGVPDKYRGETVKAFLVLKDHASVNESELDSWCRERLAAYKVPRKYEFRESLPKTMVGKVLRRKLLEEELSREDPKP